MSFTYLVNIKNFIVVVHVIAKVRETTNFTLFIFGQKIPSISLKGRSSDYSQPIMVVSIAQTKGKVAENKEIYLSMDHWYSIQLDHIIMDRTGVFTVSVDGEVVWKMNTNGDNGSQPKWIDPYWYQSDPWKPSAGDYVDVRCLRLKNLVNLVTMLVRNELIS